MLSKKTFYIILIVGLLVFFVSLVIGRPWWQALLLGIGFLLIAAVIFGGGGLLIPQAFFDWRSPVKTSKATNEEEFFKEIDMELAEFSAQPVVTTEDVHRMKEYTRVMKEVGKLVYEVHESVKAGDIAQQSRSFQVVARDLPRLISQFKDIPDLKTLKGKRMAKRQTKGLDLYLLACSNFAEALATSDGNLAGRAAVQINEALNLLDILDKSQLLGERAAS